MGRSKKEERKEKKEGKMNAFANNLEQKRNGTQDEMEKLKF